MKIIPASRRAHYLARFGILLTTVTLMAGVVSCVHPPPYPDQFNLTISSTEGGLRHEG
jgi:hypothetical protein